MSGERPTLLTIGWNCFQGRTLDSFSKRRWTISPGYSRLDSNMQIHLAFLHKKSYFSNGNKHLLRENKAHSPRQKIGVISFGTEDNIGCICKQQIEWNLSVNNMVIINTINFSLSHTVPKLKSE